MGINKITFSILLIILIGFCLFLCLKDSTYFQKITKNNYIEDYVVFVEETKSDRFSYDNIEEWKTLDSIYVEFSDKQRLIFFELLNHEDLDVLKQLDHEYLVIKSRPLFTILIAFIIELESKSHLYKENDWILLDLEFKEIVGSFEMVESVLDSKERIELAQLIFKYNSLKSSVIVDDAIKKANNIIQDGVNFFKEILK
jgi:hypothetical protein